MGMRVSRGCGVGDASLYVLVYACFVFLLNVFLFAGEAEGGW